MPLIILPRPVPLVLGFALALLLWVALGDAHLALAHRLALVIGPSPVPGLNAIQLAKLALLAALALILLGTILVALHAPHDRRERRLARRFTLALALGGAGSVGLDLAAMLGPFRLPAVEVLVEALTFAGCALLLAHHLVRSLNGPGGQRADAVPALSGSAGDAGGHGGIGLEPA